MQQRRNQDVLIETLSLAGKRVLDVGCGDGGLTRLMAQAGAIVTGVEVSPRQLAKARAAAPVAGETYHEGGAEHLPADDASVDIVVFFNSLHHVPVAGQGQALAEAARVLKPGGLAYIAEPVATGDFFELIRPVDDETEVRAHALAALRAAPDFVQDAEMTYDHPMRYPSLEAVGERVVSANAEREAIYAAREPELRELWNRLGNPVEEGGRLFLQPMRVNLLRRR